MWKMETIAIDHDEVAGITNTVQDISSFGIACSARYLSIQNYGVPGYDWNFFIVGKAIVCLCAKAERSAGKNPNFSATRVAFNGIPCYLEESILPSE